MGKLNSIKPQQNTTNSKPHDMYCKCNSGSLVILKLSFGRTGTLKFREASNKSNEVQMINFYLQINSTSYKSV